MKQYHNIENSLELEIRREFSQKLQNFIAQKKWIEDAFGQLVMHDPGLYSYKTRVKEISSVLKKIDGKIEDEKKRISDNKLSKDEAKWLNARSYNDFQDLIDDWVGCRVITYLHDTLIDLHNAIISHHRLNIVKITVHDSIENPKFKDLLIDTTRDEKRENHNGYVGIHYIISPITVDPCWSNEPKIFEKFELQIRTLLQETWGQIQHAVIYKGRMPDFIKQERSDAFAGLAGFLSQCDNELARLAKDPSLKGFVNKNITKRKRKLRQEHLRFK
ncbi:MAG: RelA/SpoT domain-containing protein [Chlorobium sp.]|jgi:ppGpp synthetase/RelA/SpoT-type nucleotidyltranferase|nr:RelA/SpoT domain-containing protein [Chlorobium sp.]